VSSIGGKKGRPSHGNTKGTSHRPRENNWLFANAVIPMETKRDPNSKTEERNLDKNDFDLTERDDGSDRSRSFVCSRSSCCLVGSTTDIRSSCYEAASRGRLPFNRVVSSELSGESFRLLGDMEDLGFVSLLFGLPRAIVLVFHTDAVVFSI
jgi:hypothetical protein